MQHKISALFIHFNTVLILGTLVLMSAFGVVYTKHLTRQLFTQLQSLEQEAEALQIEWGQLLLEQGTWAADARIERIAKERLEMHVPEPDHIVVMRDRVLKP